MAPGFLGFVSMLFLNIWKGDEQKNIASFLRICKCAFSKHLKKGWGKKLPQVF